jgi:phenylacetaldehyde dehydrogenase
MRADVEAWLARPKRNLIGGKWVPAVSGKTFDVLNPADACPAAGACVPDSQTEDINRAVDAARRAFDSGPWRRMTPSERQAAMAFGRLNPDPCR